MSSHLNDAIKIESIMLKYDLQKHDKNLPMIASQDLELPIKYIKQLIADTVKPLERVKKDIRIKRIWESCK